MNDIAVFGLGGTIAMAAGPHGLMPSHSIEALLPEFSAAGLVCKDVARIPSANLSWAIMRDLVDELRRHFATGGRGAVVVQGTDTLEEAAFIAELLGPGGGPVVFTGAMRGQSAPGADGPANLASALRVARDGSAALGVVVVMNDQIHAARRVRKAHTTATDAFSSGDIGPIGRLEDGRLSLFQDPPASLPTFSIAGDPPAVAVATIGFGSGEEALAAARHPSVRGCILQAFGAGHVPEALAPQIGRLAAEMPVVLCSRSGAGRVAEATYGYPGGEIDLLGRGVLPGARLTVSKARIALQLCLAARLGDPREAFRSLTTLAE